MKLLSLCHTDSKGGWYQEIDPYNAVSDILSTKPFNNNDYIDRLYKSIKGSDRPTLRVVHVSDFHTDPWYLEGAIANCTGRYCCRKDSVHNPPGDVKYAGKFGTLDGPCDIPVVTVEETLKYIKDTLKPDILFWTGDNSPHDRVIG